MIKQKRFRIYESLLIGLILACFSVVSASLFSTWQQVQELHVHRKVLLDLLERELSQIAPSLGSHDVAKAFYRDPIRLKTPTRLLDGKTLEFRKDRRLIELLLNLNVAIARHNDFVQMTNQAQATIAVPDNIHAQWLQDVKRRIAAVTVVRDEILKKLKENP